MTPPRVLAVVRSFAEVAAARTGRPFGANEPPVESVGADGVTPFGIVYGPIAGTWWGSLEDPQEGGDLVVQVSAAGKTADEALALIDLTRERLVTTAAPWPATVGFEVVEVTSDGLPTRPAREGTLVAVTEDLRAQVVRT